MSLIISKSLMFEFDFTIGAATMIRRFFVYFSTTESDRTLENAARARTVTLINIIHYIHCAIDWGQAPNRFLPICNTISQLHITQFKHN